MRQSVNALREESLYKTITIEKLENRLKEQAKTLSLQFSAISALSSSSNLVDTASRVLRTAARDMSLNEAAILLMDDKAGVIRHFASHGLSASKRSVVFKPGDGISGIAFKTKKCVIIDRAGTDPRFKAWGGRADAYRAQTFLSIPMMDKNIIIGVLNACAPAIPPTYRKILESLAAVMTPIIRLHQAKDREEMNFFQTIKKVMDFTEALNPYTAGHSIRVSRYAAILARALKMPDHTVTVVTRGARVHDIGKIAMMDLVKKRGSLTDQQKKMMRMHPLVGVQFVQGFDFLKDTIPIIKYHHERLDGSGYPSGLTARSIPQTVKVVTVAEVFDAMTTDRSYRGKKTFSYAIGQLRQYRGKQFDGSVIDAFLSNMDALEEMMEQVKTDSRRDLEVEFS